MTALSRLSPQFQKYFSAEPSTLIYINDHGFAFVLTPPSEPSKLFKQTCVWLNNLLNVILDGLAVTEAIAFFEKKQHVML